MGVVGVLGTLLSIDNTTVVWILSVESVRKLDISIVRDFRSSDLMNIEMSSLS